MNSTAIITSAIGLLGGGGGAALFKWLLDRKVAQVKVQQEETSLADLIGKSAKSWVSDQDDRIAVLTRDLADARRETAQLRDDVSRLSQELNAFRLGIAAPLGYVIVPRTVWEQARERDRIRGELPTVSFPGEDVEDVVRDIKDPPEGGGV